MGQTNFKQDRVRDFSDNRPGKSFCGLAFFGVVAPLAMIGCSATPPDHAHPVSAAPAMVAPVLGPVATVAAVNAVGRFSVLSVRLSHPMPRLGQTLSVYRAGFKVGEVRITGPVQDNNIVADVVSGTLEVGDEVREE